VRAGLRSLYGKRASGKRAARLMRKNSLNARGGKRFIPTIDSRHQLEASENTLNRDFHARKGGRKWISDITCLRTAGG